MRSEISSSGEVGFWVGTTRLGVVCLAAAVLTLATAFFLDLPGARWGAAVDFSSDFLGLAVSLVAFTVDFAGAFLT